MSATDLGLRRWRNQPRNWNHWSTRGNCVPNTDSPLRAAR